ncbi:MAG: hypothetical protein HZB71_04225 [Betaproteobacteria bacterium]|nr:hypothetical protein [Betaproteobacteria bacterium]
MKRVRLSLLLFIPLALPAQAQQYWPYYLLTPQPVQQGYQPSLQAPVLQPPAQAQNPYLPTPPSPPLLQGQTPAKPPAVVAPPPAAAPQAPAGPTLSDLGKSLRNTFTEEELDLLFQYMKDSVVASFKGDEVILPPDLAFKLEVVLARMKRESAVYMDKLIRQLEEDLKRSLKEKLTPPVEPAPPAGVRTNGH